MAIWLISCILYTGLRYMGVTCYYVELFTLILTTSVGIKGIQEDSHQNTTGYYECPNCHNRYVPTFWQTNLAPHIGRTRYMKCPECGKRSYQKKVLTKEWSQGCLLGGSIFYACKETRTVSVFWLFQDRPFFPLMIAARLATTEARISSPNILTWVAKCLNGSVMSRMASATEMMHEMTQMIE